MGANIYPEDVERVIYSDSFLAKNINSFSLSLEEDNKGNPRPCFEFELFDSLKKNEIEEKIKVVLSLGLAKLSLDYKKALEEYPAALEPVIRVYGLNEGVFSENKDRIKKRYVK